jgi:hypothetical protein
VLKIIDFRLNCNTNSSKNLHLENGKLSLIAIHEKHLNKEFTSAKIATKQGFTDARYQIRAALPEGKMLRPAIYLIPYNGSDAITTNINQTFSYESFNLSDFHTYGIEWKESEIKGLFDNSSYFSISTSGMSNPTYSSNYAQPFRLVIELEVVPLNHDLFRYQNSTLEYMKEWKFSSFIIDYVRIYIWDNGDKSVDYSHITFVNINESSNSSTSNKLINPEIKLTNSAMSFICFKSIIVWIVLGLKILINY